MVELSEPTRERLLVLFAAADAPAAQHILELECAENLPLIGDSATPSGLERIRFAALRLSGGNLDRLREAVAMAQVDWRDVLVAAGFGSSLSAHREWRP